jgi:hypothetical protein
MGPGNGAHAVGCRLIIEKNATAAIDLQIYEARSQESPGRETRSRPIWRDLVPGPQAGDAPIPDQYRGARMPTVTVKYAVGQNGMIAGS